MPTFTRDQLYRIGCRILQKAGVGKEEADIVATELAEANLLGHDSHGVIRLKQYHDSLLAGDIKPGAEIRTVLSIPGITILDGGFNFGQVVAAQSLEIALAHASRTGTHTLFCRNTNHVGRLGFYTCKAALQGFAALMAVNGPAHFSVAPWGGLDPRLGTNPISLAAPWKSDPLVLDMTTSTTAEGKIRIAAQAGESIPEGWIIDANGEPTTDPNEFYRGGAILPLGSALGFKGYGLGAMLDIFCGVLSGSGVVRDDLTPSTNGVWLYLINLEKIVLSEEYTAWLDNYVKWIKGSRKVPGVEEILLPGENSSRCKAYRSREGIPLSNGTWQQIRQLAHDLGVSLDD